MAARRFPRASRRADGAARDRGYGVIAYLVMGAVVLLIIAGAFLLIRLITASGGGSVSTAPSSPSVTDCSDSTWFDASTATCVPRAVCEPGDVYVEATNTCAAVLPTVTAIAPSSGLATGGTEVRITGTGFEQGASVLIDRVPAKDVTVVNATTITAVTPGSEDLFPVDVEVVNPDSEAVVLDNAFTYVAPPVQRITEINPDRGSSDGGEAVIIKGVDFVDGVVVSFFGRPAVDIEVLNASTLRVITPAGPVGRVNVNVRNPGEDTYTLEKGFRYVDQPPRVVQAVRPARGAEAGGTKVTIVGSGFSQGATVTFGKKAARKVDVVSSTRITAVTPAGPLGTVRVGVTNPGLPSAQLEDAFQYVEGPTIASVTPDTGPITGGTKVTITGTGFASDASVSVGDVVVAKVTVVDDTTIRLTMPEASRPLKVDIKVTNPGEPRALAKRAFAYTEAEPTPEPSSAKPTPTEPTTPVLPRCRNLSAGTVVGEAGNDLVLDASALFPSFMGVRGATLRNAVFQPNSGAADGSILWESSPPIVFWQTPSEPGRGGTIAYSYRAASCSGQGQGTIIVASR